MIAQGSHLTRAGLCRQCSGTCRSWNGLKSSGVAQRITHQRGYAGPLAAVGDNSVSQSPYHHHPPLVSSPSIPSIQRSAVQRGHGTHYVTGSSTALAPIVHPIFDRATASWQYIVADPSTHAAALIDPVLDYDPSDWTVSSQSADQVLAVVRKQSYKIDQILQTRIRSDYPTAALYLKNRLAEEQGDLDTPIICIGKRDKQVWERRYRPFSVSAMTSEQVFDKIFDDYELFHIGRIPGRAIYLPGHTPELMAYHIGGKHHLHFMLIIAKASGKDTFSLARKSECLTNLHLVLSIFVRKCKNAKPFPWSLAKERIKGT